MAHDRGRRRSVSAALNPFLDVTFSRFTSTLKSQLLVAFPEREKDWASGWVITAQVIRLLQHFNWQWHPCSHHEDNSVSSLALSLTTTSMYNLHTNRTYRCVDGWLSRDTSHSAKHL
uniref:Uncharacterized protein n=1 Tax=Sphaerodactylus townsendi TaxID=933632 RepID=A0ACB8GAE9_9SAUR